MCESFLPDPSCCSRACESQELHNQQHGALSPNEARVKQLLHGISSTNRGGSGQDAAEIQELISLAVSQQGHGTPRSTNPPGNKPEAPRSHLAGAHAGSGVREGRGTAIGWLAAVPTVTPSPGNGNHLAPGAAGTHPTGPASLAWG